MYRRQVFSRWRQLGRKPKKKTTYCFKKKKNSDDSVEDEILGTAAGGGAIEGVSSPLEVPSVFLPATVDAAGAGASMRCFEPSFDVEVLKLLQGEQKHR